MTVGKETDERRENRTGLNQKTRKQGETKSQTVTICNRPIVLIFSKILYSIFFFLLSKVNV